jgi:hypothetical protein
MVAVLRMSTVDPHRTPRTAEVALEVRQHRPTAELWDSCADMREGPDGMTLRVQSGTPASPVDLRLSTLTRGDVCLVMLRPTTPAHTFPAVQTATR